MTRGMTVAIQGEAGSNSEVGALQLFPDATIAPCETFTAAFDAVHDQAADAAVIPVENSSAGRVADPHQLLPNSGLYITRELFLPIHFDLVAPQGATLESIRSVRSHVHAFGQCTKLFANWKWTRHISADTAGAAREVAMMGNRSVAALAPSGIADKFDLAVLQSHVEDNDNNATRFLVLSPKPEVSQTRPAITTVLFRTKNVPAALYKCLGGFATNSVNMTKLESYQLGGSFCATQFYVDLDGHMEDPNVKRALDELHFYVADMKVMGCYPADPYREELA